MSNGDSNPRTNKGFDLRSSSPIRSLPPGVCALRITVDDIPRLCERIRDCLDRPDRLQDPGFPVDPARLRAAAVLLPLVARDEGVNVLLTRRSNALTAHAGQISFPGGRIDATDASPVAAALREAHEEIGLAGERVRVLGAMPRYPTATGFVIHPFVGFVAEAAPFVAQPDEVAEIFEVPLAFFLDPANHRPHPLEYEGKTYVLHAMPYRDYYIWGATAAILHELYRSLRTGAPDLLPRDRG